MSIAAGHRPAAARGLVVRAGQSREAIEQHERVAAHLGEPFGPLDHQPGDADVARGVLVGTGGDDFARRRVDHRGVGTAGAGERPAHLGHFLGPLVDEEDHEVHLRVVLDDRVRDVLEENRFAGSRRRDDEPALPHADRREHVHDAGRERLGAGFEADPLGGVNGGEFVPRAAAVLLGIAALDPLDGGEARAGGASSRRFERAGEVDALVEMELVHERSRDVGVGGGGGIVSGGVTEEPVTLGVHFEHPVRQCARFGHATNPNGSRRQERTDRTRPTKRSVREKKEARAGRRW